MWKVNVFVFLVFSCRYSHGHLENLIFENDPELAWEENDIWNDVDLPKTEDDSSRKLLETLCLNYNLEYKNELINCDQLKLVPKTLKVDQHTLRKRDVKDEEMEGSGEEPPVIPEVAEIEEDSNPTPETPKESEPVKESEPTEEKQQPAPVEAEGPKETEEEVVPEKSEDAKEPENASEVPATASDTPVPGVEPLSVTTKAPEDDELKIDETKSEPPKTDESETKKDESKETSEAPVKEEKVAEDELSETAEKGQESEDKAGRKITQEDLNSEQSGIALVHSNGNMIETDKEVGKMRPKESLKSKAVSANETPTTGESSEATGRKDNKLLITLFVAVLAVGAAAFTYNFVKKRRNKTAAASTGQNGTNIRTVDPEEGREMKPLMKTAEQKNNVEYNDEK